MVILSAALRGIPEETIEAAIMSMGPTPLQVFFKIKVPQIVPHNRRGLDHDYHRCSQGVRHRVYAMTNGHLGNAGFGQLHVRLKLFRANDWGVGSLPSAMVIMLYGDCPILDLERPISARKEMR